MADIEIKNLSFAYPDAPENMLKNIDLVIPEGEYITVCGKSGSGKTTLLRHLKPVLCPHGVRTGDIFIDGVPIREMTPARQSSMIGYVMQNPDSQIITDKVWHELAFGLENLGIERSVIRTCVAEMASYFGIQSWFHKETSELSGGQKQLLNLASIMAMHPEILILDEPTAQLDPIAASDFLNTVRKINLELGTTVIITEHRLEDIISSSDRVVVMEDGSIIYNDTPRTVGKALHDTNNELSYAMPAPVRIFYGVNDLNTAEPCPLTVREGRQWLNRKFNNKKNLISLFGASSEAMKKDQIVLSLKDVWFRYEKDSPDILKGVNLEIEKGTLFAMVGGNGTGKSTTLKVISRTCRPYRGSVILKGKKLDKYTSAELYKNNLSMLPQDPQSLFVKQSVREELEEMLGFELAAKYEREVEIKGSENVPLHEKVAHAAELCQISHLLDRHPYDLSGGEQQRAALAKVLLTEPDILLLDEPTKGLDAIFKIHFAKIIEKLKAKGVTVIMVSHDIEFCAEYADRIGMFFDGEITSEDSPRVFFSRNSFYTTAANRMSRHMFPTDVTSSQVITSVRKKQGQNE